jgi:dolichol-phosphate mannosyltransferase
VYNEAEMIYIVLPVYNEEDNITRVIGEIRKILNGKPYRIVAVNDGSRDRSLSILKKLQKSDLLIESYKTNMNVGAVFSTGISRVLFQAKPEDVMLIMESDSTSSSDVIPKLISGIETDGNDVVIASRYRPGGGYRNFPMMRRIFSYAASFLMRYYFPIRGVFDYTIFFRAYRVGIIQKAVEHFGRFGLIQSLGFVANAELLVKLSFFTDKISEVPFMYDYGRKKGTSKIGIARTINEYFTVITYLKSVRNRLNKGENQPAVPDRQY